MNDVMVRMQLLDRRAEHVQANVGRLSNLNTSLLVEPTASTSIPESPLWIVADRGPPGAIGLRMGLRADDSEGPGSKAISCCSNSAMNASVIF